jgi:very-short-patch-repair endonuclease
MNIDSRAEELIDNALLARKEAAFHRHEMACESPIEKLLRAAFIAYEIYPTNWINLKYMDRQGLKFDEVQKIDFRFFDHWMCLVFPQVVIDNYRVDFLAVAGVDPGTERFKQHYLAIECDGHEFHEKTKEQAARDKARDRHLTLKHIPVMRFTGSEIWRDPDKCRWEALDYFEEHFMPGQWAA